LVWRPHWQPASADFFCGKTPKGFKVYLIYQRPIALLDLLNFRRSGNVNARPRQNVERQHNFSANQAWAEQNRLTENDSEDHNEKLASTIRQSFLVSVRAFC
jgi:hypothetical protein